MITGVITALVEEALGVTRAQEDKALQDELGVLLTLMVLAVVARGVVLALLAVVMAGAALVF